MLAYQLLLIVYWSLCRLLILVQCTGYYSVLAIVSIGAVYAASFVIAHCAVHMTFIYSYYSVFRVLKNMLIPRDTLHDVAKVNIKMLCDRWYSRDQIKFKSSENNNWKDQ